VRAVDTNVLARILLADDEEQSPKAVAVLMEGAYVPLTVLLETAWVLSSVGQFDRRQVSTALREVVSAESVAVDDPDLIEWILSRYEAGAGFSDLVHAAAASLGGAEALLTFDRSFARVAEPPLSIELIE
jgi:predicted nucleic-acid-binding protein